MSRTILISTMAILALICLCFSVSAQDFLLRESSDEVIAMSGDKDPVTNVFGDENNDGVLDSVMLQGELITSQIRTDQAEGFQYEDERYIVLYPAIWSGLPQPGSKALLGFVHYFDDEHLSTYLAIVAEQAVGDETTNGLGVFFYDSAGLRVGAPNTIFMEKSRLRAVPIYQEWVELGRDFGIGSNPINSQFFVYAKDLGLVDSILIVMFQLYQ